MQESHGNVMYLGPVTMRGAPGGTASMGGNMRESDGFPQRETGFGPISGVSEPGLAGYWMNEARMMPRGMLQVCLGESRPDSLVFSSQEAGFQGGMMAMESGQRMADANAMRQSIGMQVCNASPHRDVEIACSQGMQADMRIPEGDAMRQEYLNLAIKLKQAERALVCSSLSCAVPLVRSLSSTSLSVGSLSEEVVFQRVLGDGSSHEKKLPPRKMVTQRRA